MLSPRECRTEVARAKRGHVSRMPPRSVKAMPTARRAVALLQERLSRQILPQRVWAPAVVLLRSSAICLRLLPEIPQQMLDRSAIAS